MFWKTYFTSSRKVHHLIKEYGADSFDVEIRRTFSSANDAIEWEKKVLRRMKVLKRDDWLNANIGGAFDPSLPKTVDHRKAISAALRDYVKTETHRLHLSKSISGRRASQHTKLRLSETHKDLTWMNDGITNLFVQKNQAVHLAESGWKNGRLNNNVGRRFGEHTKAMMSLKKKNRRWINKDGKSMMVTATELEEKINGGWVLGRK